MDTKSKKPHDIFPVDVWELIVEKLKLKDTYQLARTSKPMWELIRHIPVQEQLDIHPNTESVIPSFFLANIHHVKVLASRYPNSQNLSKMLSMFYDLESIDLSAVEVAEQTPKKLLFCLPRKARSRELILFVHKADRALFDEAVKKHSAKRVSVRSVLKRKKDEEDERERRLRKLGTPSPLRDDLQHLRNQIESMKETFGRIDDKLSSVVLVALATICQGRECIDVNKVWAAPDEPKTKEEADTFVDSFCGRLLESIAVSSNSSWMYIVEAEAYMRGAKEVDDCANTTITVDRPDKMKFMIEQKREFQNQWHEAKVYFKNFEFLVTGCLCGKYNDEDDDDKNNNNNSVDAFLGASLGIHVDAGDYWRVYVPVMPVQAVAECRLLRNFTKRASGFKWHLKSERFHVNEFSTACALRLHTVRSVDSIVAIGSLLLDWKVLDQENKQQLRSMLSNVEVLRGLAVDATSKSVATVRELQLSRGKKLAIEIALLVLGDEQVENSSYVEIFKALMSPRLKTLNNQAIRRKKYLLV